MSGEDIEPIGEPVASFAVGAQAAARADLALMLDDLSRWVGMDSPSGDLDGLDAVARDIARAAERAGARIRLDATAAGPYLAARLAGTGRARVILLCHHDTVYPRGTARARPVALDGDVARGPGVADMKGGIAVAVHALRILAADPRRFAEVTLLSVPDEESRTVAFDGVGATADADAVLCLECGRPGNGIVTERKGGNWLTIDATGRSAHAGVAPETGRSALLAACREALRVAALDGARDGLAVNVTMLRAGEVISAIAERASMEIDMRAWHPDDLDWGLDAVAAFEAHDGVTLSMATSLRLPPLERTHAVARLAAAALQLGEALRTPIAEVATGGVSDVCWAAAAGATALDGLGPIGGDDHSPAEWIDVPSLADRCGLVAGLVGAINTGLLTPETTTDQGASR